MRPGLLGSPAAAATHGAAATFWRWNSPLAYVFVGVAAMMGLIAVALIILVCSNRKSSSGGSSSSSSTHHGISAGEKVALTPLDVDPKIVVIMPGEDTPSFLANAVSFAGPQPTQPLPPGGQGAETASAV